jgi:hypothetical protein
MIKIMKLYIFAIFILTIPAAISAKTIAFVGVQNQSGDAQYDYLGAYIEGVILFDLSGVKEITLVERSRLDKIISEQQLSALGLTKEGLQKQTIEIGRLLSADYLVSADYTIIQKEAAFTVRLADAKTGTVRVFTSRGSTENDIHLLAEGLAKTLSGKEFSFENKAEKRSLLTLRDTTPGSISLYSNLINAEILLDGKFAAYTNGNIYTPLQIPDLDPGTYTMKIRLSKDFGMVKLPEFTFSDWEEKVTVKPGRATVTRSIIRHFNDVIYENLKLLNEDYQLTDNEPRKKVEKNISFVDRTGKNVPIKVMISGDRQSEAKEIICTVIFDGKENILKISKDSPVIKKEIGKIKVELELNISNTQIDKISIYITRTDIHQGMHRE